MATASEPVMPYDVLTPSQAAEYLQVEEKTVIQEAETGRLPGQKVGGQWRFLRLAIVEWLRSVPPGDSLKASRDRLLALAGIWEGDPTVDAMIEEIYQKRKSNRVGKR